MRFAALVLAVMFASVSPRAGADDAAVPGSSPSPDRSSATAVLREARRVFHDVARPPYVVYTLARSDRRLSLLTIPQNYRMRVWYRASDGGALERAIGSRGAGGNLMYVQPRFNAPLDPGPPTADVFEPAPAVSPQPKLAVDPGLKEIGTLTVPIEADYRATFAPCDTTCYHLRLEPRRDPDRNRLRELWLERPTLRLTRLVATDKLFYGTSGVVVPQLFDVRMDVVEGIPVVRSIVSRNADYDPNGTPFDHDEYRFTDVSFPPSLPDWYFEPATYRAHIAQAPDH